MMSRPSGRGDAGSRERKPRQGERDRLTRPPQAPKPTPKNIDPIFSSPYEPAPPAAAAPRPAPTVQRAPRQVAALLGGLPKSKV
jgi:hypothetical protein